MHLAINLSCELQQVRVIDAQNLDQGIKKSYDHQFGVALKRLECILIMISHPSGPAKPDHSHVKLSTVVPVAYKVSVQNEKEYSIS